MPEELRLQLVAGHLRLLNGLLRLFALGFTPRLLPAGPGIVLRVQREGKRQNQTVAIFTIHSCSIGGTESPR